MKRSEFVAQLAGYLSTLNPFTGIPQGNLVIVSLAEDLTKLFEREGLLPKTPPGTNFAPKWEPEIIQFGEDNLD